MTSLLAFVAFTAHSGQRFPTSKLLSFTTACSNAKSAFCVERPAKYFQRTAPTSKTGFTLNLPSSPMCSNTQPALVSGDMLTKAEYGEQDV